MYIGDRRYVIGVGFLASALLAVALLLLSGCGTQSGAAAGTAKRSLAAQAAAQEMVLATTTSTYDSGLLDAILPDFERNYGVKVKVVAVGTGQALALGAKGDADVVLVHAWDKEEQFVAAGDGVERRAVMHNDFVLVGPPTDPAGVAGLKQVAEAFRKIAAAGGEGKALFLSRGDDSGTHAKEKGLWKKAGIKPTGGWYLSLGQGMGETLIAASERRGYTLTDRGTYLTMKDKLELKVMVGGDSIAENRDQDLLNPYGVIAVNPKKHPGVKYNLAVKLSDWITSSRVQKMIGEFGREKYGQSLFYPDAGKAP